MAETLATPNSPTIDSETKRFFDDDVLRCRVFLDKYALRGVDGKPVEKVPAEMWRRVAREIAGTRTPMLGINIGAGFDLTDRLSVGASMTLGSGFEQLGFVGPIISSAMVNAAVA